MTKKKNGYAILAAAVCGALGLAAHRASAANTIGDVFVIDMENRNATQPATDTSAPAQIYGNPAAPYINSLITPGNPNAAQVSYTSTYFNVLSTPSGSNPSIHPSEPNYLWQEAGSNLGITDDGDPYGPGGTAGNVAKIATFLTGNPTVSGQNLTGLMQAKGLSWKTYQEGTNQLLANGTNINSNASTAGNPLTNNNPAASQFTVPLVSFSGNSTAYANPSNGSNQFNFAAKHDGTLFFPDTNGGNDLTTANVEASHYAPLNQLYLDLNNNTAARYNLITPDQFNDMHTALSAGINYNGTHYTGDLAQLAQGDQFLSEIIPKIEASAAYKNNGMIVIWTDETEGTNQNDYTHTLMEIVISPLAKGNAYNSNAGVILNGAGAATGVTDPSKVYTHSSDLKTLQEIFQTPAATSNGFLNDAGAPNTNDLSDLFVPGTIPTTVATAVPEPASLGVLAVGMIGLFARRRRVKTVG